MLKTELIKEVCFEASNQPELMAALLRYKPSLGKQTENPFKKDHFHVVYLDLNTGPRIVFHRGGDRPWEIPAINFETRLLGLPELNFEEVCFLIATYGNEEILKSNDQVNWDSVPEKLKNIILATKGYLVFEDQGIELYRSLCEENNQAAFEWLDQIKKYKKQGWQQFLKMTSDSFSVDDLKNLFLHPDYAPSFKRKPVNEAYDILSQLSEDYQIIEEHETWLHLRLDGSYLHEDQEKLFLEDELLKAKLKKDALGNYRIAFWLKNEQIHIDQEIEIGLNYEYASLNEIAALTGWYVLPNENQFIIDFTATIELPDKSDFCTLSMKANFNFALPEELKRHKMIYKLYQ